MAYQSGLISDTMTRLSRRRSLTGRSLTLEEMRGFYEPMLSYEAQKGIAAGEREQSQNNFNRQFALQEKAQRDAERAAAISGVADIGIGAGNLYLTNKYLGLLKGGHAGAAATTVPSVGGLSTPFAASPYASLSTAASSAPSLAGSTTFGGAAGGGAGLTGGAAGGGSAAAIGGTSVPYATTASATGATAGAGEAGLLSIAGSVAAPAALGGGVGSYVGGRFHEKIGVNEDIGQGIGGALGGAVTGFMVGGPAGAVVGGLIGIGVSLIDDLF